MLSKQAGQALTAVIRPTTLIDSARLKKHLDLDVILASETFQVTGSFKFRAAYNQALNVPNQHIVTASSGNFGQALAYSCHLLGKRCTVVMPHNSAKVKVEGVRAFGGEVELVDTTQKTREQRVAELMLEYPAAYMASPYNDPLVIEGNASLGRELAACDPPFDAVLAPVGGGGLVSGLIEGFGQKPVDVYGVEPKLANDAARSFKAGHIVKQDTEPQTIADGARTLSIGEHNWRIIKDKMKDIIEVDEDLIMQAMKDLFRYANVKAEPTGSVALAGAMAARRLFAGKRICCVVSGGNVDAEVFHRVICAG